MAMTAKQLRDLLQEVPDTREIVIAPSPRSAGEDELQAAWRVAHDDASRALAAWRAAPGAESYAAYRAAEDRADSALDGLTQA